MVVATLPWLLSPDNHMWARWITCTLLGLAIPWFREMTYAPVNTISYTVAKYSYGIYLTHIVSLNVTFGMMRDQPAMVQVIVFVAMAGLLPLATFHLIESPMIARGRRLARRHTSRPGQPRLGGAA
jgi:peptidoglycan/LPS O-acetylase OafA/YrhL